MKCPLRMKAFDRPDTCDPECAWRMGDADGRYDSCAVAVIAGAETLFLAPAENASMARKRKDVG